MAHFSNCIKTPASPVGASLNFVTSRIAGAMSNFRAILSAKSDIRYLTEYSDDELADIGLLRSELSEALFENAVDMQAEAMLRVYR